MTKRCFAQQLQQSAFVRTDLRACERHKDVPPSFEWRHRNSKPSREGVAPRERRCPKIHDGFLAKATPIPDESLATMIKVLLVDDDRDTLRLLRTNLEREGYHVSSIADPRVAIAEMRRFQPDLVFLDVMLPGTDGLDICRQIRRTRDLAEAGLIIVSALDSETDRVAGLEVGADDYISKPFSVREVLARTRAVLRRRDHRGQQDGRVHWEHLVVDPRKHLVRVGTRNVELSALEFKLLYFLATNRGHVFSRDNLLDKVWGTDRSVTPRNVDVCIRRIREKIEPKADNPQYIQTIHGVGYRFGGDET